jgi:hypothetical protein
MTIAFRRGLALAATVALCGGMAGGAHAQAWVPAAGTATTTLDYQKTMVNYHLFGNDMTAFGGDADGRADLGKIRGQSIQLGIDYGIARNLAFSASVAYVGATYHGTFPEDEMDDVTFNGTLQDASLGLRYMVPWQGFAITPNVSFSFPTHEYSHHGHTAVGKGNTALSAGLAIGRTLDPVASNVWLQATYAHQFVKDVEEWGLDANEVTGSAGWFPMSRLAVSGYYTYHSTTDGIDWFYSDFTEQVEEHHDQAAQTKFHRAGGTLGYQLNATTGMFLDVGTILSGRNTHDGVSYTFGTTWSFLGPSIH